MSTLLILAAALITIVIALNALQGAARRKVAAQFNTMLSQQVRMALTLNGYVEGKQGWTRPGCRGAVRVEITTNASTGKVRVALTESTTSKGSSLTLGGNVLVLSDQLAMQDQARKFVMDGCAEYIKPALDMKGLGKSVLGGIDRLERKLFPSKYSK